MRTIDAITAEVLKGSRSGDELVCWVWYDGQSILSEPLPVSSWSFTWDGNEKQKVHGSLQLTIADADGTLSPWLFDDPLGVGGSRIQAIYKVGGAGEVNLGWYRIEENTSAESWRFHLIKEAGYVDPASELETGVRYLVSPTGASVELSARDLTLELDADEFVAPQQPKGTAPTVKTEVERLIGLGLPILYSRFTDGPVPRDVVWEGNRLEAIMDMLESVGAAYRMTGDGELEIYTKDPTPVFTCAGGDNGVAINMTRSMNLSDVYNIGVVTSSYKDSQTIDGRVQDVDVPIYGYYEISSGSLRSTGPLGRRVVRAANPLMNTQDKANLAAKTMVMNRLAALRVELEVICLPNPAIQHGDTVTVVNPVVDGRQVPLNGEVVNMKLSGSPTVNAMSLTVSCLLSDVASALKGYSIADRLTGQTGTSGATWETVNPLRTWGQMNKSWG